MRLIRFHHKDRVGVGLLHGDRIVDAGRRMGLQTICALLDPGARDKAASMAAQGDFDLTLPDVRLLPPLDPQARIFAVGINYKSHAAETGHDMPVRPFIFVRTQESVVAHGEPIVRPAVSTHFDYEGELAVVIGRATHRVSEADALSHVAGYTCFNDGSVRDYQKVSVSAGKNFDRSGSCGPWIVTSDEIPDPAQLTLVTRLNGHEMQRATTDLLIYPIPLIVSYLSEITALRPGDIIATGTPGGVGSRRTPQLWMKAGDRVEIDITGVGVLANDVVDEG